MAEMAKQTDRGAAITGAAYLALFLSSKESKFNGHPETIYREFSVGSPPAARMWRKASDLRPYPEPRDDR
jgi:hypothetical protein